MSWTTALAVPDVRLHASWAAALRDFGSEYPHGSGNEEGVVQPVDEASCAAVVAARLRHADPTAELPTGQVPCSYFWLLEDDDVVGFLAVRHRLTEALLEHGGHIGYSVRRAARGRGHASRALRLGLDHAAGLGIERALLSARPDNTASRRTIERAGGVLEDTRGGQARYWVETRPAPTRPVSAGGGAPARP